MIASAMGSMAAFDMLLPARSIVATLGPGSGASLARSWFSLTFESRASSLSAGAGAAGGTAPCPAGRVDGGRLLVVPRVAGGGGGGAGDSAGATTGGDRGASATVVGTCAPPPSSSVACLTACHCIPDGSDTGIATLRVTPPWATMSLPIATSDVYGDTRP